MNGRHSTSAIANRQMITERREQGREAAVARMAFGACVSQTKNAHLSASRRRSD
jgi:hypothetical protein